MFISHYWVAFGLSVLHNIKDGQFPPRQNLIASTFFHDHSALGVRPQAQFGYQSFGTHLILSVQMSNQ
jgi:hypothetical protein